jgi:hypothetical protein
MLENYNNAQPSESAKGKETPIESPWRRNMFVLAGCQNQNSEIEKNTYAHGIDNSMHICEKK